MNNLYSRKILPEILKWLDDPEIILLIGSRQVGKTSLLHLIIKELRSRNIPEDLIHFFNLEDLNIFRVLNAGPQDFVNYLTTHGIDISKRNYIFIDEIQYLDNPSNFLKLLADEYKTLKIFTTGSSTLLIKEKFKDSLVGRKQVFEIHPLSFKEYLLFKGSPQLINIIDKNSLYKIIIDNLMPPVEDLHILTPELKPLFEEYSLYGGYPKVSLESDYMKKSRDLLEIYNFYIRKDIKDLMWIENVTSFNNLIQLLALQIGNLFNHQTATKSLGIARETLQKYIFLLENTFIVKMVQPFFKNRKKEIIKMPKIYFQDTGLRNAILGNFHTLDLRTDTGHIMENTIYSQLAKTLDPLLRINFWRTTSKNEVDFIVVKDVIIPIEIKYQTFKEPDISSGLRSFIGEYNPLLAIIITKDYLAKTSFGKTSILFLPPWFTEL